ncbi:FAD-binding protein [Streptomyces sparsogenes]|uniref:FAD-binding protein n=1 Tax=Streptomyces sparsogenes TaxID=67365 RepID=UPI0033CFE210
MSRSASTAELAEAVRDAGRDGQRVKAVGAGHSFSPVAVAPGVQPRLDRMDGLCAADRASGLVTVEAGCRSGSSARSSPGTAL